VLQLQRAALWSWTWPGAQPVHVHVRTHGTL